MILLQRHAQLTDGVMGRLLFGGDEVYTVERPWRCNKPFESCIPDGEYALRPYSSPKYPHVWEVCDVPGRTHILIHVANKPEELAGCIAPGMRSRLPGSVGVDSSRVACSKVFEFLAAQVSPVLTIKSVRCSLEDCV